MSLKTKEELTIIKNSKFPIVVLRRLKILDHHLETKSLLFPNGKDSKGKIVDVKKESPSCENIKSNCVPIFKDNVSSIKNKNCEPNWTYINMVPNPLVLNQICDNEQEKGKFFDMKVNVEISSTKCSSNHKNSTKCSSNHKNSTKCSSNHKNSTKLSSNHKNSTKRSSNHKISTKCSSKHKNSPKCSSKHKNSPKCSSKHKNSTKCSSNHKNSTKCSSNHKNPTKCSSNHKNSTKCSSKQKNSKCSSTQKKSTKSSSNRKSFICNLCYCCFVGKSVLRNHMVIHTDSRPYKCENCSYAGKLKCHLISHKKYRCKETDLKCVNGSFDSKPKIDQRIHDSTSLPFYKCKVCPYTTSSLYQFSYHTFACLKSQSNEKPYKCDKCSYAGRVKQQLTEHLKRHLTVRPFKCHICMYAAKRRNTLRIHFRIHDIYKLFMCKKCPFYSNLELLFLRHVKNHNANKPFKCPKCSYSSSLKVDILRHIELH